MPFKISDISLVTQQEILPGVVMDSGLDSHFMNWKLSAFVQHPPTASVTARLSATRKVDSRVIFADLHINSKLIERAQDANVIFSVIDNALMAAVKQFEDCVIVEHVAGVVCKNVFCEECYK